MRCLIAPEAGPDKAVADPTRGIACLARPEREVGKS